MSEPNTARSFWIPEPDRGEIREAPLDPPGRGEVLVRARYSGVSRGTESLVFRGRVPESQYDRMRAPFQEGDFPAPVKYGYASVGRIESIGPGVGELASGQAIFCLHPHQDRYVVPATWVHPLPDGVPEERAVLAANMETAVNGAWDARPSVGDRIVVVGGGVVGLLVGWLMAGIPGTRVRLVDPNPAREGVARPLGMAWEAQAGEGAGEADLVVHASGTPQGLADALPLAGPEATVLELSWFGDATVPLPLGEEFHHRRLTLRSSQVGTLPPHRTPRWDHRRRMGLALRLLQAPELDALLTGESAFQDLPATMERLVRDPGDNLCHRVRYPGAGPA